MSAHDGMATASGVGASGSAGTVRGVGALSLRLCPARAKAENARPAAVSARDAAASRVVEAQKALDDWSDLSTNPGRVVREQVDPATIPSHLAAADAELARAKVVAYVAEQALIAADQEIERCETSAEAAVNHEGAHRLAEIRAKHDRLKAELKAVIQEESDLITEGSRVLGAIRRGPGLFQLRPAIG